MGDYTWWQNALKGEMGPVHEGDPQPGYYRNSSKKYGDYPVAIWPDDEGKIIACKGFNQQPCDADDIWTFVCKNPVEYDFYKEAVGAGKWPDSPPSPPEIGDNLPDDPAEALQVELNGQMEGLEAFLKTDITEQSQADKAAAWASNLADIGKKAENQRKVEKQPSIDLGKQIDAKWNPIRDSAKGLSIDLKRHTDAWLREQARIEQERQRRAQEEADRLRAEADEKARGANSMDAVEEAEQVLEEVHNLEQEAEARTTKAGRTGASLSLRTFTDAEITDFDKLLEALKDRDEVKTLVQTLANRAAKSGVELPGMKISKTQRAA